MRGGRAPRDRGRRVASCRRRGHRADQDADQPPADRVVPVVRAITRVEGAAAGRASARGRAASSDGWRHVRSCGRERGATPRRRDRSEGRDAGSDVAADAVGCTATMPSCTHQPTATTGSASPTAELPIGDDVRLVRPARLRRGRAVQRHRPRPRRRIATRRRAPRPTRPTTSRSSPGSPTIVAEPARAGPTIGRVALLHRIGRLGSGEIARSSWSCRRRTAPRRSRPHGTRSTRSRRRCRSGSTRSGRTAPTGAPARTTGRRVRWCRSGRSSGVIVDHRAGRRRRRDRRGRRASCCRAALAPLERRRRLVPPPDRRAVARGPPAVVDQVHNAASRRSRPTTGDADRGRRHRTTPHRTTVRPTADDGWRRWHVTWRSTSARRTRSST